jgi:hypothetical protein
MSTASISGLLPLVGDRISDKATCTAHVDDLRASGEFLCCDLPHNHDGSVHHDPVDGLWQVLLHREQDVWPA